MGEVENNIIPFVQKSNGCDKKEEVTGEARANCESPFEVTIQKNNKDKERLRKDRMRTNEKVLRSYKIRK